jgi:hypothetical protein
MVLISVTRLHVKSPRYLPAFMWHNALSIWQIINTPGFKGGKLFRDARGGFWTMTAWADKSAMQHYRNSGAHRKVMPLLQKWCDEAAVVHWEQANSSLPDAVEAHHRMVGEGHFTRLSDSSVAHLERKIPQPLSDNIPGLTLCPRKTVPPTVLA